MYNKQIKPLKKRIYLSSPTMHGEEMNFVKEAYETNWMSTVGENIDEVSKKCSEIIGTKYSVPLSCGTSAIHLAVKLAKVKRNEKVFCSDMTFSATVNPVVYEGGVPVFIDSERETWNLDPKALEKAFSLYPDVRVVILVHLYGTPAKIDEIKEICNKHNAILIEDAAEAFGATYKNKKVGSFGDYNIISFNGNKIITGSCGGMLLTDDQDAAVLATKWANQSRENATWYQHVDLGYNYRMSNVVAGVVRGQLPHLFEHIEQKKKIYFNYKKYLKNIPVLMNPYDENICTPNYWLSCLLIKKEFMAKQIREDNNYFYKKERQKSSPSEILEILSKHNIEGRPIWKPMHMQPIFKNNDFVYVESEPVDEDIFNRGLCLPSDNKMSLEEQMFVIDIIKDCFE